MAKGRTPATIYLRFVVAGKHKVSGVRNGVFNDAYALVRGDTLSVAERGILRVHLDWFDANLPAPARFNRSSSKGNYRRASRGIAWLKPTAEEYISRMREMILILEEHGFLVTMIKSNRPGYIVYEDEYQIVAEPFADTGA